jgi:hypothetical protein
MVQVDSLVTLKPDEVGGWTMDLKVKSIGFTVTGSPEVAGGKIINGNFDVKDINIVSSAVVNLNINAEITSATYLGLKQAISKIHYTILFNKTYTLDLYFYNPDTNDKVMYSTSNFSQASYMTPYSEPTLYKWLLTSADDLVDSKSQEAKLIKKDGVYTQNVKLVFRSVRVG